MKHFTRLQFLGTLAVCAALFSCVREEAPYTILLPAPAIDSEKEIKTALDTEVLFQKLRQELSEASSQGASTSAAESQPLPPVELQAAPTNAAENQQPSSGEPQEVPTNAAETESSSSGEPQEAQTNAAESQSSSMFGKLKAAPSTRYASHLRFINREVRFDNVKMFPGWMDMLARYSAQSHKYDTICGTELYNPCKLKDWNKLLNDLSGVPLAEQMNAVNDFINKYPRIEDVVNRGVRNYWETPYEFQRHSGNSKDYAVAKFMLLRALGVPNDMMRVEVVRDSNRGGIIHAVLVVFMDEKPYMLDNQIKEIIPTSKVYHYVPVYGINEQHWWQSFMVK